MEKWLRNRSIHPSDTELDWDGRGVAFSELARSVLQPTGLSGHHWSEKGTWHLCPGKGWHKGPRWHSGKRNRWGMMGQCAPRTVSSLWLELGTLLGKCQDMRLGENPIKTTATICRWETADTWGSLCTLGRWPALCWGPLRTEPRQGASQKLQEPVRRSHPGEREDSR